MELPDFHIPHADKIEWMIETDGWALEPVAPDTASEPPTPGYAYSIGMPDAVGFPDVAVFGLTPVATKGLVTLVADACRGAAAQVAVAAMSGQVAAQWPAKDEVAAVAPAPTAEGMAKAVVACLAG